MPLVAAAQSYGLVVLVSLATLVFVRALSRGTAYVDSKTAASVDAAVGLRGFGNMSTTNHVLFGLLLLIPLTLHAVDSRWARFNRRLAKAVGTDVDLVADKGDAGGAGNSLEVALRSAAANSWDVPEIERRRNQQPQPTPQG